MRANQMSRQRPQKVYRQKPGGISVLAVLGLILLLVVPSYALSRLAVSVDWRLLAGVPLAVSVFTFFAYRADKDRAEDGRRRIPESTLHLGELAGGWPGGFLGQRAFRHKISKASYQVEFWIIVIIHQLVAVDSLIGWRLTKAVGHFIEAYSG